MMSGNAKLIGVCTRETTFQRRQMPLEESDIKMVVQFSNRGECEGQYNKKDLDKFIAKVSALEKDDLVVSLMVTKKELFNHLAQSLPCVGCRRSVENLFVSLERSGYPTLEPLVVTQHSELSVSADVRDNRSLYCLFYIHGPRHRAVLDTITKGRGKKRCNLHSLDTHKVKTPSCWTEVWQLMSAECQVAVLTISCVKFEETLSAYLTKHRFCTECRAKVMLAYSILVGEQDGQQEKGFCVRLFEKLRTCSKDGHRHIHVSEDDTYLEMLINMAEPELTGTNRRDRHAKTLDIAQEEVLTCLGLHVYERLHKIAQRLRQEEQTWSLLFCLGVEALQKNFECAVELKQGVSNLERMCEEMEEEERLREQRREQKRQKKKRRKAAAKTGRENQAQLIDIHEAPHCQCSSVSIATKPLQTSHLAQCDNHTSHHHCLPPPPPAPSPSPSPSLTTPNNNPASCDHPYPHHYHHHHLHQHHNHSCVDSSSNCRTSNGHSQDGLSLNGHHDCSSGNGSGLSRHQNCGSGGLAVNEHHDCNGGLSVNGHHPEDCGLQVNGHHDWDYGSEAEGCDNCNILSSSDGSDLCWDGTCSNEGEECSLSLEQCFHQCQPAGGSPERKFRQIHSAHCPHPPHSCHRAKVMSSLQEMLASTLSCEDEEEEESGDCGISEEDIRRFQANRSSVQQQRLELRENLKRRFQTLRQQGASPMHSPSTSPHLCSRFEHA